MRIPHGLSNFGDVRRGGYFYVDKTPFIQMLENGSASYRYVVFLRPKRMGKSLFVSMLEHYYDLARADEFDDLYNGLFIREQPTSERGSYLVLSFDFSLVKATGGKGALERTFFDAIKSRVLSFVLRYREKIPTLGWLLDHIGDHHDAESLIGALLSLTAQTGRKLYVLIDECDAFVDDLISSGQEAFLRVQIENSGFVRGFFRALQSGTQTGALGRMFVTGVTPLLLDEMASGFSALTHISSNPRFNAMVGFVRPDVERAVSGFLAAHPDLGAQLSIDERDDRDEILRLLEQHYDGYRFSPDAPGRVFNADMVLYFFRELEQTGRVPAQLLDPNVRTGYSRLRRLATPAGAAGGVHRELLEAILTDGFVLSNLAERFGISSLSFRQEFVSLLYFLGLLTIGTQPPDTARLRLEVSNRVMRSLQLEHFAALLCEDRMALDPEELQTALEAMAMRGDIEPFLELFHGRVIKALVKDARRLDERSVKLMLLTFLSRAGLLHLLSDKEIAHGHGTLLLGVMPSARMSRWGWMIEVRLVSGEARPERIDRAFGEADEQLRRYCADSSLVAQLRGGRSLRAAILVFVGVHEVRSRFWEVAPASGSRASLASV